MDQEMIERCITAVRGEFQKAKTQQAPLDRVDYKDIVLAVIKAMREPTEVMFDMLPSDWSKRDEYDAKKVWQDMIDGIIE